MDIKKININSNIDFGVRIKSRQVKAAVREIKGKAEPFLKENEPLYTSIETLRGKISAADDKISKFSKYPDYDVKQFREVKRLRLGELSGNIWEYRYLRDKSQQYFSNQEAQNYAREISHLFVVPKKLQSANNAYSQLLSDIYNGLHGDLPLNLRNKQNNLLRSNNKLFFTTSDYNDVLYYMENMHKLIEHRIKNVRKYKDISDKIDRHITRYNEDLPLIRQYVAEAGDIFERNTFTSEELKAMEKNHSQQVISRCVNKFNKNLAVKNTQLSKVENAEIDNLLSQQKQTIENLWNMIEKSKKSYFETLEKSLHHCSKYPDDMPF